VRNDLPSALNHVNRKTLDADNAALARVSVLKQGVELGDDHRLQDVYSIGNHGPPPPLTVGFDGLRLDNL